MTEEIERVRAVVSGRVQGVYFRQSTALEAQAAGVAGWVRNLADGRVEAVFEGSHESVDRMLAYVAHGPVRAHVDDVDTTRETPEGAVGFSIR
jgi:acylphosphatase